MGPQEDYIETVLTCEGDYYDPEFPGQLEQFSERLRHLLLDEEQKLIIKKVEPWNSVKVTFNIPKEAAQRLKQLAEQGNHALRALGVLAVQIEGDRVISLTLAGKNDERTELVLRTTDGAPHGVNPSTSMFDMSSNDELNVPGQSNVEATSRNIAQYLSQQGEGSAGMFDSVFNLPQSSTGMDMFRSPNVVATMSEPIPFPPLSQGQFTQSRPLGISTTSTASQFSYPPGRSPTGYPTSQGIPSPGYSRSPSASGSPKFPSPMQSPSPSSFQTPPTPPPPYPSMQNINNLPRMVLNKAGMMQSPLLVNLLQNEAAQQAAAGHHINNLQPNKMPPPPPEMSPPQKRKRKKHKDKESRKQNLTTAQMTTTPTSNSTNSDSKSEQKKKQRQTDMAPEDKEKFIAHLDDIMQNIINPDSPSGADNNAADSMSPVHRTDRSSFSAGDAESQASSSASSQLSGLASPINSVSVNQSNSDSTDSIVKKIIPPSALGVSTCGSLATSMIYPGPGLAASYDVRGANPPLTSSSFKGVRAPGSIISSGPLSFGTPSIFASRENHATSVQGLLESKSNPLRAGTGTTGAMPMFSNSQSAFGSHVSEKLSKGLGIHDVGLSLSSTVTSSVLSLSGPGNRDLPVNTSARVLPPPEPEPEHIQDPYEGIPPGTEVIINPYTGQLEPIDSINDGSIEGLDNDKSHQNSKEKVTDKSDSVSPKHKNISEAAKEKSPFRAVGPEDSRRVTDGSNINSSVNDSRMDSSVSSESNQGIVVPKSKAAPLVSTNSREKSIQISQTNTVTIRGDRSPVFGIGTSGILTSTASSQSSVSNANVSPDTAACSVQPVPHNSHGETDCSEGEHTELTGYKIGATSTASVKSPLPSIHYTEANSTCATGSNGPISLSPGASHSVDTCSRRSPENRVHTSPHGSRGYSDSCSTKSPVHVRSPVQINHAMESTKSGLSETIFKDKLLSNIPSGLLHLDGEKDTSIGCISLSESVGLRHSHVDTKIMASVDTNTFDVSSEMRSQNSIPALGPSQIDKIKSEISASKDNIEDVTNSASGVMVKPSLHGDVTVNQRSPTQLNCDGPVFSKLPSNQPSYGLQKSPIRITNHRQDHNDPAGISGDQSQPASQDKATTSNPSLMTGRTPMVNAKSPTNEHGGGDSYRKSVDGSTAYHNATDSERSNAVPNADGQNLGIRINVRRTDSGYMSMEHSSENSEQKIHCDTKPMDENRAQNASHENERNDLGHAEHGNSVQGEFLIDGAKIVKENSIGTANYSEEHLNAEDKDLKLSRLNMSADELRNLEKIAFEKLQRSKGISILKPLYDRDAELSEEMVSELKDLKERAVDTCAKIPGKKDTAKAAVSLANSTILTSLQPTKNVLSIDKLLEESSSAKQASKVAADMSGVMKQGVKTPQDINPQAAAPVASSKKEEMGNRSTSPRNCTHMPNLISKAGPDLSFFNSAPHPITAPIFPFNLTQSVKKVVGPIPSSDRPIKLKPLPSPSSPRSTSPRGHAYSRSMSQGVDSTSPLSTRTHTSPMSSVSRMSPNMCANLPDSNISPPKSTSISPSSYRPPQRMDMPLDTSVKNVDSIMRYQSSDGDSLTSVVSSRKNTSLSTSSSHLPCVTPSKSGQSVTTVCKGNTSEATPVNTGVSLHNPTSTVPPVSPPVNSALPPNLTEIHLPLAVDSSHSGNPSCDISSDSQSSSCNSKTCVPKCNVHALQAVPGADTISTPSKLNESVMHTPVEMHQVASHPLEPGQMQTSCVSTKLSESDCSVPNNSDAGNLSDHVYVHQKMAGDVAGSTLSQLSQGNQNALDSLIDPGTIKPKVEIKIEDTTLQDHDIKPHVVQNVSEMKSEPDDMELPDEPMLARLRTPRGSTEHKNEDTISEIGDQAENNLITKTLRGGRTIIERPESPSLRVGRSQRLRRKTPTPSEELETKSDTTDRSESPKPTRPQRTKRRILEDGEFHDLVVPNKRTRTLTEDSIGSSKTGCSLDSSEDELNSGELTVGKARSVLKHKVNAKSDDVENIDRVSPRHRRPTPKMEAAEMKRSTGRQSRSNSRGASDGMPVEENQDNGAKSKPTRAGSRETRKPSDEAEKNQPMNTRRNTERSKARERSPQRATREKSPSRVRSRRNSPNRERKDPSPEPVNRRTTRSTRPKDNPDSLPPPANKRRRSSRDHR